MFRFRTIDRPITQILAVVGDGRVDHLLQAVDLRRERRHDHAAGCLRDDLAHARPDRHLRRGGAGVLGVGRVRHQQRHALVTERAQAIDVDRAAVHRRHVHLEVAGVHDHAVRRVQHHRHRIGDRVRDAHHLGLERPHRHARSVRNHLHQLRLGAQAVLVQLRLDQPQRQPGAEHERMRPGLAQQVGQRADVVLVAVGEHDRLQPVGAVDHVGEVGQHQVDAVHLRLGEGEAGVDQDQVAAGLEHGHVLPNLAQPAERDDLDGFAHRQPAATGRIPASSSAAWSVAVCAASASTSGRRSPPTSWPSRFSAAFSGIGLVVIESTS